MKKLKIFILLAGILSLFSCSNKISVIEEFHNTLDASTDESLIVEYFEFADSATKDNLTLMYKDLFNTIKSYKALGTYEVLKYHKARKNWVAIPEVSGSEISSNTYVVKYSNNEFLYFHFSNDKIQSMLPIKKGDVIAGWF